jgi:hypothetical protein
MRCGNSCLSDGKEGKTIGNESPTVVKVDIQEFKTRATIY